MDNLIQQHRQAILRIAEAHGAHHVRIFGSVARHSASDESDIDLLVDFEPGRTLLDHAALILDLEDLLGKKVDVATVGGLRERIRPTVLREAVAL